MLTLIKNKTDFILQGGAADAEYRVNFKHIEWSARKFEISPSVNLATEKQLALSSGAIIPYVHLSANNHAIPRGTTNIVILRIVNGQLPMRQFYCLVSAASFNGDRSKSPFNYLPHDLQSIQLTVNTKAEPARPLKFDFANDNYHELYKLFCTTIGAYRDNVGPDISYENFKNGNVIYAFNLRPDREVGLDTVPTRQDGNISVSLSFTGQTSEGLLLLVFSEFANTCYFDKLRNYTTNHGVH